MFITYWNFIVLLNFRYWKLFYANFCKILWQRFDALYNVQEQLFDEVQYKKFIINIFYYLPPGVGSTESIEGDEHIQHSDDCVRGSYPMATAAQVPYCELCSASWFQCQCLGCPPAVHPLRCFRWTQGCCHRWLHIPSEIFAYFMQLKFTKTWE